MGEGISSCKTYWNFVVPKKRLTIKRTIDNVICFCVVLICNLVLKKKLSISLVFLKPWTSAYACSPGTHGGSAAHCKRGDWDFQRRSLCIGIRHVSVCVYTCVHLYVYSWLQVYTYVYAMCTVKRRRCVESELVDDIQGSSDELDVNTRHGSLLTGKITLYCFSIASRY